GMPQTHVLRDTGDHRTWVTRANPSIVFQRPVERFSIDDRSWQRLAPDESSAAGMATFWRAVQCA
ncbi:MAG: hypothetical protein ACKVQT_07360, partial [Burkholderiales bacterium]